jgi:thiamine-phosphate pyrophosphorylase
MPRRQPLPRLLLMTDERIGDGLWSALARLPRGSGVVFRHHATPPAARRQLFQAVRRFARRRRLLLVLAGDLRTACAWQADGVHGRIRQRVPKRMLHTSPAHDLRELAVGRPDLVFVSPVFATRSHPEASALGPLRLAMLARRSACPVIALGGMDPRRFRRVARLGAYGWAGIDAWSAAQARPRT